MPPSRKFTSTPDLNRQTSTPGGGGSLDGEFSPFEHVMLDVALQAVCTGLRMEVEALQVRTTGHFTWTTWVSGNSTTTPAWLKLPKEHCLQLLRQATFPESQFNASGAPKCSC